MNCAINNHRKIFRVHLQHFCSKPRFFLSELFAIDDKSPDQGDPEYDQDDPIDAVDDMNIMWCEAVADLSSEKNFKYIGTQHPRKTGNKHHDPLLYRMIDDRCGSIDPENKYRRI